MRPMLASNAPDDLNSIVYPILCSTKLDGIRALKLDGKIKSRSLKEIPNLFVRKELQNLPDGLDGELMSDGEFNLIQSDVMSEDGEPNFKFHVFDLISDKGYWDRINSISINHPRVVVIKCELVNNEKELVSLLDQTLKGGNEGLIARSIDGPYKFGRSTPKEGFMMKIKPFEDTEGVVVGFEERLKNTNEKKINELGLTKRSFKLSGMVPSGTLGVIIVSHPEFGLVRIGGGVGLTKNLRDMIWSNRDKFLGKILKFKFQRMGSIDKPRIGTFLGFRNELDMDINL